MAIMRALAFLLVLAFAMSGCSMSANTAAAEQGVATFHSQLDAGQFAQMYQASSDGLKKITAEQPFVAFLESVHGKLGATRSSKQTDWKVNYVNGATLVTLHYKTSYANGDADEEFIFQVDGQKASLAGYHMSTTSMH
jgi:uncharacterized protein YcfL